MKTVEDIQKKINSMQQEIDDLHVWRYDSLEKYGGIYDEDNADFHSDLSILVNQIKILNWVLENEKV